MGSYKTPASATACYLAAKKKLLQSAGPVPGAAPGLAASTPLAGKKHKNNAEATNGNGNKQKRRKKVATTVESSEADEDATVAIPAVKSEDRNELESGGNVEAGPQIKQEQFDELVTDHLLATAAEYLADAEQKVQSTMETDDRADTPVA